MELQETIQKVKNEVYNHCEFNPDYIEGGEFSELLFVGEKGFDVNFSVSYEFSPGDNSIPDYLHMEVSTNSIEMINEDESVELIYINT